MFILISFILFLPVSLSTTDTTDTTETTDDTETA
jgi:hypothetical protein